MYKAPKWTYVRTYFGVGYTPEEVDQMFRKHLIDWANGDQYAIIFEHDKVAQVLYDRLNFNWFEKTPGEAVEAFFK